MIAQSDILARCPELVSITDEDEWNAAILDATNLVDPNLWNGTGQTLQATVYLAAHYLGVNYPALLKGPTVATQAGQVSRQQSALGRLPSRDDLSSTKYGQRFMSLSANLATARIP